MLLQVSQHLPSDHGIFAHVPNARVAMIAEQVAERAGSVVVIDVQDGEHASLLADLQCFGWPAADGTDAALPLKPRVIFSERDTVSALEVAIASDLVGNRFSAASVAARLAMTSDSALSLFRRREVFSRLVFTAKRASVHASILPPIIALCENHSTRI